MNFVALDFETANNKRSSVCAIGLVVVENGKIVKKMYELIKPSDMQFNWHNINVHGINPEDVETKQEFDFHWDTIYNYLKEGQLIAHNASFDVGVLRAVLAEYNITIPDIKYTCSVQISKKTWEGWGSYSLDNVAQNLGFSFKHHHALEDAEMCANVVLEAAKELNVNSIEELNSKLKIKTKNLIK